MKVIRKIPFSEIESIPQFIRDFLEQKHENFNTEIFSLENFRNKIQAKKEVFTETQRQVLVEVLRAQMNGLALSSLQNSNIDKLSENSSFTVTTGHQLNLFSGPVFFIYKILQTVKTAHYLKQHFPQQNFVPLFWMATEDHDFEEINHFKTQNGFYETAALSGGAVGRIKLTDLSFIKEFEKEFRDHVFGTELVLMMKEAYSGNKTLAEATRILVNRLFGEYGLLILDGDDSRLKEQMKEVFREELVGSALQHQTESVVEKIREEYGKVQVNPREINLFYLSETRNRIDRISESFQIDGTEQKFTQQEILQELQRNPGKFSPNALMRPVFQERILPNIAYIGGNAEIMYWLELKDYFLHLGIPFPVLIPRNSMLFVTEKNLKKISKAGLEISDFFRNFSELTSGKLISGNKIHELLNEKEELLKTQFEELKESASETDITFGNLVEAEKTRQLKSFNRMQKRLLRAERIKQREYLERLENLFHEIHPGKTWQERVWNFSVFYADHGKQWLETCLKEMEVEKSEMIIVAD